jgi:signal transduction histidine kinase
LDESLLTCVFQNLITNAIKYRSGEPPFIQINYQEGYDAYEFTVRDNGKGVAERDKDRIFFLYQRGAETEEIPGRGLGLALCKKIITGYGGDIWCESSFGKGTTFHFTVPKTPSVYVGQEMR